MGKGMLRNWQRPGAGRGGGGQEGGGLGERWQWGGGDWEGGMGTGRWGGGQWWGGKRGTGEVRGQQGGEKGQEEGGFHRWKWWNAWVVIGLCIGSKQIERLGRQGLWHSLIAANTWNAWVEWGYRVFWLMDTLFTRATPGTPASIIYNLLFAFVDAL